MLWTEDRSIIVSGSEASIVGADGHASLYSIPNEFVVDLEADAPAWLILNQNYHPDWQLVSGNSLGPVQNKDGLLAVRVPPGRQTVRLRFQARAYRIGLWLSIPSWLASSTIVMS